MPTYVYECASCHQVFEVEQRITEDALTDCIKCSIGKVKRVIQPVGISFKGSGFYVNDSKSTNPVASPKPEPAAAPGPEAVAAPAVAAETPSPPASE